MTAFEGWTCQQCGGFVPSGVLHSCSRPINYYSPPHGPSIRRCPTCEGRGIVPRGFFRVPAGQTFMDSETGPEECRTCKGTGLISVAYDGSVKPAKAAA